MRTRTGAVLIIGACLCLSSPSALAYVPTAESGGVVAEVPATEYSDALATAMTADGGSVVAGSLENLTAAPSLTAGFGECSLNTFTERQAYLVRYDSNARRDWVASIGLTSASDHVDVAYAGVASDGTIRIAGDIYGDAAFGSTHVTSPSGATIGFAASYSASGGLLWVTQLGDDYDSVQCGTMLEDGTLLVGGVLTSADVAFPTSAGVVHLTGPGSDHGFLARVGSSGQILAAVEAGQVAPAHATSRVNGITALADGSAVVGGSYVGSVTFGSTTLTGAVGASRPFLSRLDTSGNVQWAIDPWGMADDSWVVDVSANDGGLVTIVGLDGSTYDTHAARVRADGAVVWTTLVAARSSDPNGRTEPVGVTAAADGSSLLAIDAFDITTVGATTLGEAGASSVDVIRLADDGSIEGASQTAVSDPGGEVKAKAFAADAAGRFSLVGWVATSARLVGGTQIVGTYEGFAIRGLGASVATSGSDAAPVSTTARATEASAVGVRRPAVSIVDAVTMRAGRRMAIRIDARVSGSGDLRVQALGRSRSAQTLCTARRHAARAGHRTLVCVLRPAAQQALSVSALRVGLRLRFRSSTGGVAVATRALTLPRMATTPLEAVTG